MNGCLCCVGLGNFHSLGYCIFVFFLLLGLFFVYSLLAGEKSVTKITYFVSIGTLNLNPVTQLACLLVSVVYPSEQRVPGCSKSRLV